MIPEKFADLVDDAERHKSKLPEGPFTVGGPHTSTRTVDDPKDLHWSVFDGHQGSIAHFAKKEHAELFIRLLLSLPLTQTASMHGAEGMEDTRSKLSDIP